MASLIVFIVRRVGITNTEPSHQNNELYLVKMVMTTTFSGATEWVQ